MKSIITKLQANFPVRGFNIISNMGEIAYQSIFHLHLHIIPKYEKNQGFIWTAQSALKYNLDQINEKLK
jgi:histidine triad (HIT) family protein